MSAVTNTPSNKNYLSPLGFRLQIKRAPNTSFFLQKAQFPGIQLQSSNIPSPFIPIPNPATRIQFNDFSIDFVVDEDMQNYLEIHNWMRGIGSPTDFVDYGNITKNPLYTGEALKSDVVLTILNSVKQPNIEIVFVDAFPIEMGSLQFFTTAETVQYVTCQTTFKYQHYEIKRL